MLGTSIGGINGAFVAAHPVSGVTQLGQLWQQDSNDTLLGDGLVSQLRTLRRTLISLPLQRSARVAALGGAGSVHPHDRADD